MVELTDETFKEMCLERVDTFANGSYSSEFWDEALDRLAENGWLEPEYNRPSYIVDNIYVNGEIRTADEMRSENDFGFDENTTDEEIEAKAEEEGWDKCAEYYIINWGL